ncbi:MAG TPA: DUF3105 domain-containing protein [Solirubrobacteraceae bacterium]|jgi:hypothetical protein
MGSREQAKREARERREAAERKTAAAAARRRRAWLAAAVAALLVVIAVPVVLLAGGSGGGEDTDPGIAAGAIPPQRETDLARAVRAAGARQISDDYELGINVHTPEPVRYRTNPPTNGPHAPVPARDGDYAGLAAPPTEAVVHAQEHGRIVIQYRPGLPRATLAKLVALYEESPDHVLLVENATRMPCEVAATAWAHGVLCPKVTDATYDALRAFRDTYRDKAPETAV